MASGVQTSGYPHPPQNFPHHGHSASMSASFNQPPLGSFEAHSVASTPAPTPPPPRQSQQQMAYGMNGGHMSNGMMPPNNYSGYPDPTQPYGHPQQHPQPPPQAQYYQNGGMPKPQIYTAVYSNISVFEMEVNGVAVMRRRVDSWLNATQILKVAGVDKGKRTKVLEKEVQNGEHEKVQGGYGKYQGTWINYQRGREFCRQYGVEQLLLPLLEYDLNNDGMPGVQQGDTPTKEQAMAAQRKRMYGNESRPMTQSAGGTFFKNMSSTAANAIQALNRTRLESPNQMDGRRSMGPRRTSQQQYSQENIYQGGSQQSMHSMPSQDSFSNGGMLSQGASFADFPNTDAQEPPRKRIRPSPQNSFMNPYDGTMDLSMQDGSPTEPNQSFFSNHGASFMGMQPISYGLEPLPHPGSPLEERKREFLLDLFIDPSRTDFEDHPAFLQLSGDEFELPIDGSCNTALHWAATLARIPLVRKLLERGFNMRRTNSGGETALIAACQARNNLDQSTFPALLELLGPSIELRDGRGRTLLHHVAVSSAMKGRAAVGRYYLESLLEYVVRQGSASQATSFEGINGASQSQNLMTLARFMSEIVNAQDKSGDTALNLAARTSTTTIIDQLIEVGADPHIGNRGGLAPIDFGVGNDGNTQLLEHSANMFDLPGVANGLSQKSFEEAQEGLMSSIRQALSQSEVDFQSEMKEKNELLDKTNAALKESGSSLVEERKKLDDLRSKAREKDELEAKIQNLRRTAKEISTEIAHDLPRSPILPQQHPHVTIGEADKGLDFDGRLALCERLFGGNAAVFNNGGSIIDNTNLSTMSLNPEQAAFLASLERSEVLQGRVKAYQNHNAGLEGLRTGLRGRSADLEDRYRRIVSLCTGAKVEMVDELLDGLVQAVISERKAGAGGAVVVEENRNGNVNASADLELGRVREFLRLVKGQA